MSAELAQAAGWAVVHSLWQGAVAAAGLGIALAATRSARVRYASACAALVTMSAAFALTLWRSIPNAGERLVVTARDGRTAAGAGDARQIAPGRNAAEATMPWIAAFWAAGVIVFQLRTAANWRAARRIRVTGVCAPPGMWVERLETLRTRLRVSRPVTLLESSLADAPAVVGTLRPVILMPVGILAGLPVAQVEAVLLHELAHIRRGDYLVNVAQSIAEAVFFYHPAAWWISSVMRGERENCCDDLAAAALGDAHEYANALAALEQTRWSADPAVAATGGSLMRRIRRLLKQSEGPRVTLAPALFAALIAVAGAVALFGWQSRPAQERGAAGASPYVKWVQEDVGYIMSDRERAAFAALRTDEEREKFIEQFWQRRDPTPGTPKNELKEEHYRRIAYSNERYGDDKVAGWKTDRGRVYIQLGPPDEIESHPSGGLSGLNFPYEIWRYRGDAYLFVDRNRTNEYRLAPDAPIRR